MKTLHARDALLLLVLSLSHQDHDLIVPGEALSGVLDGGSSVAAVHSPELDAREPQVAAVGLKYLLEVDEDGPYHLELRSYFFDSYLVLRGPDGRVLAEDDNGLLGEHARIQVELEAYEEYYVEACALYGGRGAYALQLLAGVPEPLDGDARRAAEERDAIRRTEVVERSAGNDAGPRAMLLGRLGVEQLNRGFARTARTLLERSLAICDQELTPEHPQTVEALGRLAILHWNAGDAAASRPYYERLLAFHEAALGPDHPTTARSLHDVADVNRALGEHDAARHAYEQSLRIRELNLGSEHADTQHTRTMLAVSLWEQTHFEAAQPLFERALQVSEKTLGPDHAETATCLDNLAANLLGSGVFDEALSYARRALDIRSTALGPDHSLTGLSLVRVGQILRRQYNFDEAMSALERALSIMEKRHGPDDWRTAWSRIEFANVLRDLAEYEDALPLYERSLASYQETWGPTALRTAAAMQDLGLLHWNLGDYTAALPLYQQALEIREAALGSDHTQTAISLSELADVHGALGDVDTARRLGERSLQINRRVLGRDHLTTATSLSSLGTLLLQLGDFDAARPLMQEALSITEESLGPDDLQTASRLNNLAYLLWEAEEFEESKRLLERALRISRDVVGDGHPETATSLNNLAYLLWELGDLEAARPYYEESLRISEDTLGPDHWSTAVTRSSLARLLQDSGEPEAAAPLHERALATLQRTLGLENDYTVDALLSLARLHVDAGDLRVAWDLTGRGLAARRATFEANLAALTEAESYRYLARLLEQLELRLYLADHLQSPAASDEAYADVLFLKGRVGRILAESRQRIHRDAGEQVRALVDRLRSCSRKLSSHALETDISDPETNRRRLETLRIERDRLELELRRATQDHARGRAELEPELLRNALPRSSAMVDFLVHRTWNPAAIEPGEPIRRGARGEAVVSAWICRPDREGIVRVDLGPAKALERAARAHLAQIAGPGRPSDVSRGVSLAGKRSQDAPAALRRALWEPLAPHLDGAATVFVYPDGALAALPFETIQQEGGRFLIEDHAFVYLENVDSLLERPASMNHSDLDSLLVVGAVDYARRDDASAQQTFGSSAAGGRPRGSHLRGSLTRDWQALPATEQESLAVLDLHAAAYDGGRRLLLQGAEPTEERLKQELGRYAVLHFATHGFFQPAGVPSMWASARNGAAPSLPQLSAEGKRLVGRHPSLLSGLVCAGANLAAQAERDDGYLTAEEVSWLDLGSVRLVVLSACETGLGRAQAGEGLLGLRRAFRTCGAETIVSSLWAVADESTAELMREFYSNLFRRGMGCLEALRSAQLAMLERNRTILGSGVPSTWGAFVLSGDWR